MLNDGGAAGGIGIGGIGSGIDVDIAIAAAGGPAQRQQPGRVPRLARRLRDALRGQVIVKVAGAYHSVKRAPAPGGPDCAGVMAMLWVTLWRYEVVTGTMLSPRRQTLYIPSLPIGATSQPGAPDIPGGCRRAVLSQKPPGRDGPGWRRRVTGQIGRYAWRARLGRQICPPPE